MVNDIEIFARVFLAMALGFVIGLERNTNESQVAEKFRIGGVRTFILISLLGSISGLFINSQFEIIAYLSFSFLLILVLISYVLYYFGIKSLGVTTEIATVITFLIGFAVTVDVVEIKIIFAVVILMAFILSQKEGIHDLIKRIERYEVTDMIKFGVLSIAVFPFLPNYNYKISDISILVDALNSSNIDISRFQDIFIINPWKVWFIIVLLSGLSIFAYFISKYFGSKKAHIVTPIIAGLVSSTSFISTNASRSKSENSSKKINMLSASSLIAHGVSFIPILSLMFIINFKLFNILFVPLAIMAIVSIIIGLIVIMFDKANDMKNDSEIEKRLFSLNPAIKFVVILSIFNVISQFALITLGNAGFYLSNLISSIVGMDPVTVSISELGGKVVSLNVAAYTLIGAVAINALWKLAYSFFEGDKNFTRTLSSGMAISFLSGVVAYLIAIIL